MNDAFERLVQERCDLEIKLHRLSEFLEVCSDEFDRALNGVSEQHYSLLEKQERCMLEYLKILEERIKLFRVEH